MSRSSVRLTQLFLVLFGAVATSFGQNEYRHTFLMAGNPAGQQITRTRGANTREIEFEFNDRGRGPKLKTTIRTAPDGSLLELRTDGNNYLKRPVAETFSIENGLARWKNAAEKGETQHANKAFYVSMDGAPDEIALLAQALLKSPTKSLPLLPAGEASIEQFHETTLKNGDQTKRVVGYEISGLGFTPLPVWLGSDGELFGYVSSWSSIISSGWEAIAPSLVKIQDDRDAARYSKLANTLTRKPDRPLAFINANLFDAETGKSFPNSTVIVEGDRITTVGKSKKVKVPNGAETIDAKGKSLMPGLWDMHVHMFPGDGLMHIAAGVTSVRDLANDTDQLQALKKSIDGGTEIGPRILMTGFMDGRGPYAGPTKVFVDTEAEAHAAIDKYARLGYGGIKIYSSIKPELVPTIISLAKAKGLRVSGHVPAFMTAEQFVKAGADELQHTNFLFLNFFDDVKDTRTPARFTAVADRAAGLDLSTPQVRAFIKLLKDRNTVVDPTLSIFEGMFTDRPGSMSIGYESIADRLPPQVRRGMLYGGLPVPEGKDEGYRASARALMSMVKGLFDAGVTIVPGTDSMAGFALHRELELYNLAGISASEVLRIATIVSARVMNRDRDLGSIAPGKLADMVVIDGDPTRRISDVRRVTLVVKDGKVYQAADLYKSIGVRSVTGR